MKPIFITGIGTDVGKTLVSAMVVEALEADYWKPVQAGFDAGTDAHTVQELISNQHNRIHPECYRLALPASPHISAREEGTEVSREKIMQAFHALPLTSRPLVVEGAGGLMVPLSENYFVADLIRDLDARVIIVSRNYLGSINHSLLTARVLKSLHVEVMGWIFNDQYLHYEQEIVHWSGFPALSSVPYMPEINQDSVLKEAAKLRPVLRNLL